MKIDKHTMGKPGDAGMRQPKVRDEQRSLSTLICTAAIAGLALLGLQGCGSKAPAGKAEKLTIAEAIYPSFALVYIAEAKGFFKEAGLEVSFKPFPVGRDAVTDVLEGGSDIATANTTPFVSRVYEGKPLSVIGAISSSSRGTSIVARRDHGIWAPQDLKGKRIGIPKGTSAEYFLSVFMATESLAPGDLSVVYLDPEAQQKALLDGRIDAATAFKAFQLRFTEALGERAIVFHTDAYVESAVLVGATEVIKQRPEAMKRLMKALVRAQDYAERDPEDSIRVVSARVAGAFDEALVRSGWSDFRLEATLSHALVSLMTREAQWMRNAGRFSSPVPDFAAASAPDALRSARPNAVTMLARSKGG
jgi:ABC-type nitrate/sulfonate/bicarbonate transport system substrate-binding protein